MLQAEGNKEPVKVEFDNFEHGFPEGFGPGGWGHLAYAIALAFAVFQLYVAAFNYLPSQVVRGVHVGFLLLLSFGLIGNFTAKQGLIPRSPPQGGRLEGWPQKDCALGFFSNAIALRDRGMHETKSTTGLGME